MELSTSKESDSFSANRIQNDSIQFSTNEKPLVNSTSPNETTNKQDDTSLDILVSTFTKEKSNVEKLSKLSAEYEKITTNDDSDSLFETKTKQNLIKTFKFNSHSMYHLKNTKFNYSEIACQNNHNIQQAKMAFYDSLLNKGN
jgi:hypothetical protein